ncbi:MAG: 30S ribosomal protein S1 [Polyangia bacterium]|jgi:small subunit ribosomal protein S1
MSEPDDPNPEEDFAALLAEYDQKERDPKAGARRREPQLGEEVRGKVVSIGRDAVFVDLGGKADGMLETAELRDPDGKLTVAVGDEIEARVVEVGGKAGCVVLRRAFGRGAGPAELAQAHAHQIPVEGLVTGVNKGGLEVQVAGVRAFCPISQLELRHVEDATIYVGQRLTFRITKYDEGSRGLDVVLSRRSILEDEARSQADATRAHLAIGAVLRGKVTSLKDYGAFVDLGGIEGMLHVSELGFRRVKHPKDVLTVGQEIEVQVVKLEKSDDPKRPERISLSLKSLERDPFSEVATRFPEGARAAGIVTRVEPFGAFVEIAPGVEGLIHLSELGGNKRLRHARDAAKVGQRLDVLVLAVDVSQRRISLALADPNDDGTPAPSSGPAPSLGTFADLLKKR